MLAQVLFAQAMLLLILVEHGISAVPTPAHLQLVPRRSVHVGSADAAVVLLTAQRVLVWRDSRQPRSLGINKAPMLPDAIEGRITPARPTAAAMAGYVVAGVVGASVQEDIAFRGFLLWHLQLRMPLVAASLLAAGIFSMIHDERFVRSPLQYVAVSLVIGAAFLCTGNLCAPILAHALWDCWGWDDCWHTCKSSSKRVS